MRFKNYIDGDTLSVVELCYFIQNGNNLSETTVLEKGINSVLTKLGFKLHKGRGLVHVLASAGKNTGLLFYYAFKVAAGENEYKEKIKEISKSVKKEDVVDILLKLDMLTMHAITGPIHIIDAITGWHVGANLKSMSHNVETKVKNVIIHLSDLYKTATGEVKDTIHGFLTQIKRIYGVE